jgi:soluble cytochrome b562
MLRSAMSLGLAICLVASSGGIAEAGHTQQSPATTLSTQAKNHEQVQLAVQQQQVAEQEIEAAILHLQEDIGQLQQQQSRYPESNEIKASITRLQVLLSQIQKAQANVQVGQTAHAGDPVDLSKDKVAAMAEQTEKLKQISAMAQTAATQGAGLTARTIVDSKSPAAVPVPAALPPPAPRGIGHALEGANHGNRSDPWREGHCS